MPSTNRWTLNPRKWFGTISYAAQKNDKISAHLPPVPTTASSSTRTVSITNPRMSPTKNKTNVIPISISDDTTKNTTTMIASITQLQLPAFSIRRDRLAALLPSTTVLARQNTFTQAHTEPSIRKNGRVDEPLSIDAKNRLSIQQRTSLSKAKTTQIVKQQNSPSNLKTNQSEIISVSNISHQCLVDYPKYVANILLESSTPTRSSQSSISSLYEGSNLSSSDMFTDERTRHESNDALSALEVLSMESIADSQGPLHRTFTRPIIHHHRRPISDFETIEKIPERRNKSSKHSQRSQSVQDAFKNEQMMSTTKSRQSSVATNKKIDKHIAENRSAALQLEKVGIVRISSDRYRFTTSNTNNEAHSDKRSLESFVPSLCYDESLGPAKNEESYATLPRTSSTDQLYNNMHNDLRVLVDECIRPVMPRITKSRFSKHSQQRSKRTNIHTDRTQLNIQHITNRLISSMDCSTYSRYQRCY